MTITIGAWTIPVVLTVLCIAMMLRPYRQRGDYDFGSVFRIFWLMPVGFIWAAYFGILVWFRHHK